MNEIISKIQNDPLLMLMAIVAVVVLLVIVLVVVVSAMRVKTYKDRWWNVSVDNKEKTEQIALISHELEAYKMRNANTAKELLRFDETKEHLKSLQEKFDALQTNFDEQAKELHQFKEKLQNNQEIYATLLETHNTLKQTYENLLEENSRYKVNNARLLMKLESEERTTQNAKDKKQ